MFGFFTKNSELDRLKKDLSTAKENAKHFYAMKDNAEEKASVELESLAHRLGVSAAKAAKTKEGTKILSEVVLNRQWAFYHNEQAIQLQAAVNRMGNNGKSREPVLGDDYWFDNVVTPAGLDIVLDQIDTICGKLIAETDERLK